MIDLYTWTTPNGRKVSILLEEVGADYEAHSIDIGAGAQFAPDFLQIAPNNRIPAIVDRATGQTLMETGAIMLYLADRFGVFMPRGAEHWRALEWLMWQMGGFGPMLGQAHHFAQFNPGKAPYAEERYVNEAARLYGVLDRRLEGRAFIAGEGRGEYSVADMACWPWAARFEWQRIDLADFPNVRDWYLRIAERPAVQQGYHVPKFVADIPMP